MTTGPRPSQSQIRRRCRRAFTLMEVVVVMTIMGVMIALPAPMFARAVEQSRLDFAAANLRAIWGAERYFFLEHDRYGTLDELARAADGLDPLVDPSLVSGGAFYGYDVAVGGDGRSFVATAAHAETPGCSGAIAIDETGLLSGQVRCGDRPLTVGGESAP